MTLNTINNVDYFVAFDVTFKIISTLDFKRELQAKERLVSFPSSQQMILPRNYEAMIMLEDLGFVRVM